MRYTVLLTPETDAVGFEGYVAYVPVLGVVTQGATIEAAIEAAGEAAYLQIMGHLDDGADVPVESEGGIVARIAVEVPALASAT